MTVLLLDNPAHKTKSGIRNHTTRPEPIVALEIETDTPLPLVSFKRLDCHFSPKEAYILGMSLIHSAAVASDDYAIQQQLIKEVGFTADQAGKFLRATGQRRRDFLRSHVPFQAEGDPH